MHRNVKVSVNMRAALFLLIHIANNELNTTYTLPPPPQQIGPVLQEVQYVSTSYAMFVYVGLCLLVKKVILFARVMFMSRVRSMQRGKHFEFSY